MRSADRVHDCTLLDALSAIRPIPFDGEAWRITRKCRDPLRGSAADGRWSPGGDVEVLYTALAPDGALAEIGYRLSLEPVWPSRIEHQLHHLNVACDRTLKLAAMDDLAALGVDVSRYQTFDYAQTQAVAAAACFLEFDGLIAPGARSEHLNLVLFLENRTPEQKLIVLASTDVDWTAWRENRRPLKPLSFPVGRGR